MIKWRIAHGIGHIHKTSACVGYSDVVPVVANVITKNVMLPVLLIGPWEIQMKF